MGRPSSYSDDIAQRILAGLEEGKSLRAVCREDGMPSPTAVLSWMEKPEYSAFSEQYTRVRTRAYQLLADEIIEISDDSEGDIIDTEHGPKVDAERVARSKLRVDSRKWMLSKMLPKVYGDKLDLNHSGRVQFEKIECVVVDPAG